MLREKESVLTLIYFPTIKRYTSNESHDHTSCFEAKVEHIIERIKFSLLLVSDLLVVDFGVASGELKSQTRDGKE